MFKIFSVAVVACIVVTPGTLMAQSKSLSEIMNIYVFPKDEQDEVQQSADEAACYEWSMERTGTDPFELAREAREQKEAANRAMAEAQTAGEGSTGKAAASGAVAGALIGGIFGRGRNSGLRGAAVGATTGAIVGSSQESQAKAEASAEVAQDAAATKAASKEEMDGFKNAFTTCLEAKDYIANF